MVIKFIFLNHCHHGNQNYEFEAVSLLRLFKLLTLYYRRSETEKNVVMGLAGPKIKNNHAGKGQQHITTPDQQRSCITVTVVTIKVDIRKLTAQ